MEQKITPWEAISAQLINKATLAQKQIIQEWLKSSPEHSVFLSEIVNTWALTKQKSEFYQPDLTINWEKLMKKINHLSKLKATRKIYLQWITAAAVLLIVFLVGIGLGDSFLLPTAKVSFTKIIAPEGNKTQIVLPDSTYVWLNSGSVLEYSSDYSAQNRQVRMKGECFFDVVKDPNHPFVVQCSKFKVKVFGTRFNVNEHDTKNLTDVTLVSGKIQVLNLQDQLISELLPRQQLIFEEGKFRVQQAQNIEALTAWLNNMLIFDNQPFEEVIHYLEKWYGVKIHLDHSLYYSHSYTFKVKTESLREVMELISVITPIEYQIEGEQVNIKYKKP
jgi:ferric-dicitrate binding protein FerR (iron transport regulator)